jgi:hypothetical protein
LLVENCSTDSSFRGVGVKYLSATIVRKFVKELGYDGFAVRRNSTSSNRCSALVDMADEPGVFLGSFVASVDERHDESST